MTTHDFGILLGLAYQGFVDELHRDLARHGLTDLGPAYGYVVRALDASPDLRQHELAARLGITAQGAGKIVDEMVRRDFLVRTPDPEDRRAWRLSLGSRGHELLKRAKSHHARFERRLARELGSSVATTRRVLEHIVAASDDATAQGRLRAI